jgi:hypothetical protein
MIPDRWCDAPAVKSIKAPTRRRFNVQGCGTLATQVDTLVNLVLQLYRLPIRPGLFLSTLTCALDQRLDDLGSTSLKVWGFYH